MPCVYVISGVTAVPLHSQLTPHVYVIMLCVCFIYLFVLQQAHMFCIHSLTPHAGLHYFLPPRVAVWDLQHSVLILNEDNFSGITTLHGDGNSEEAIFPIVQFV